MSELQSPAPDGFLPGLSPKGGWFSDFEFHEGGLTVHKTGTKIRLDGALIGECLNWFGYHLIVRARSWALAATRAPGPAIWFTPDKPRPWYLIWAAMAWSGCRMARSPEAADACFCFEDATWGLRALPPTNAPLTSAAWTSPRAMCRRCSRRCSAIPWPSTPRPSSARPWRRAN
uniref:Uncharacterized protein n=1 Tax=Phenylobacterium glaciei TaxID=2803784 RepID=A0A974P5P9_9CAUL|nr:hypothetical protein JKL49_08865 [Phenylobacterium glaciei]